MSEPLAKIRVTEGHGIRRFMYPLTAIIDMPSSTNFIALGAGTMDNDIDMKRGRLLAEDGTAIPMQIEHVHMPSETGVFRFIVDFAISLEPHGEHVLALIGSDVPLQALDDPLQLSLGPDGQLVNRQLHFGMIINHLGDIDSVTYGGISHLRAPLAVLRNDRTEKRIGMRSPLTLQPISDRTRTFHMRQKRVSAIQETQIVASKSWANLTYTVLETSPYEDIEFHLSLQATSPQLTCDFGVGGGTYGKLQAGSAEDIAWRTVFDRQGSARWTLATAGRVDYEGKAHTIGEYRPQCWFHLIDSDKSLAVAITRIPANCEEMKVTLNHRGDTTIAFSLSEEVLKNAEFGVCYHFLNDIPAIAAATNPQSILLPPMVEVLRDQ